MTIEIVNPVTTRPKNEVIMNISKRLRLCALILIGTAPLAPSMHGMQRAKIFVAQAARAAKNHGVKFKPQTRLALAAGNNIQTTSAPLFYAQKPLLFYTTTQVKAAQTTIKNSPQQGGQTSPGERARITKLIDDHITEVTQEMKLVTTVAEFAWLPGYILKKNTDRIEGAKIFSGIIDKHNLKFVTIPEQWIYTIPPQRNAPRDKHLVVAKKLEGTFSKPINLEQAQDIATLLKYARYKGEYYGDTHNGNLLHQANGKIGFIDTEASLGFSCPTYSQALQNLLWFHEMDPQAELFIKTEIDKQKWWWQR